MKPDTEKVLSILAAHENNAANLIAILQDVQAEYNYLSEANLTLIADKRIPRLQRSDVLRELFARSQGKAHHQGLRRHSLPCAQIRPDLRCGV